MGIFAGLFSVLFFKQLKIHTLFSAGPSSMEINTQTQIHVQISNVDQYYLLSGHNFWNGENENIIHDLERYTHRIE